MQFQKIIIVYNFQSDIVIQNAEDGGCQTSRPPLPLAPPPPPTPIHTLPPLTTHFTHSALYWGKRLEHMHGSVTLLQDSVAE